MILAHVFLRENTIFFKKKVVLILILYLSII